MRYFTLDDQINKDMGIVTAHTPEDALYILIANPTEWMVTSTDEIHGDYLAKFSAAPDHNDLQNVADKCQLPMETLYVRKPGTHPGGRAWWICTHETIEQLILEPIDMAG